LGGYNFGTLFKETRYRAFYRHGLNDIVISPRLFKFPVDAQELDLASWEHINRVARKRQSTSCVRTEHPIPDGSESSLVKDLNISVLLERLVELLHAIDKSAD
jgi:hypothetical protein